MSNKKRLQSRAASSKGKQRAGGPGALILPIVVVIFVLPWATSGRIDIVRMVWRAALRLFYGVMF